MSYEEKGIWVYLVTSLAAYLVHVVIVFGRVISRFGEYVTRWFVIAGAAAGLCMAMARWDYFWIANVIYLGFVLWAVAGSALKLVAYRRGL